MKLLLIRHGESVDDIVDRYGGSADFDLTENGKLQVMESARRIATLNENFEVIFSSPLKRALQSAEIVAGELGISIEVVEYLQERNLNGILTGLVRNEAILKYPDVVAAHNRWEYVDGSEREADFNTRVVNGFKYLLNQKYSTAVVMTHGLFLKALIKEFMDLEIKKVGDGGWFFVEEDAGVWTLLESDGVDFS